MIPPPPPPPRDQKIRSPNPTHHAPQNSPSSFASGPPPPAPSNNVYTAPKSNYEPYGEVTVGTATSSSSGISHRRSVNEGQTLGNSPGYSSYGGATNTNRYAMPPSSYGKPKSPKVGEKRDHLQQQKQLQYQYNGASMFALCSTLVSILWWHESPIVIQIFLFIALTLYGLDLINSRDTLTVGLWIAALILSVTSGIGTLLLVDDNDAVGSNMILFLLQLGVESMFYCTMVSGCGGVCCVVCLLCCVPVDGDTIE